MNATLDPNLPDENTYTPMHAAASYGQIEVLKFLISKGGNVNVTDEDGDTPLYTVENIQTAKFLVDNGASIDHRNNEGISPIEHLSEDFPDVSAFLQSLITSTILNDPSTTTSTSQPSQHAQNASAELLTSQLMTSAAEIIQRAEAEGRDPENELRAVVSRAVAQGVLTGFQLTENANTNATSDDRLTREDKDTPSKRARMEE
ncbi:hypothetical protein H0H93_010531 [Arthromyces matolae]|nr:hypothetical protein H0H93_010531 [Arthromyces matolae]